MYGVVCRKKKKGKTEFYKDIWYYRCKRRVKIDTEYCDYKTHIRQDEIDNQVTIVMKEALQNFDFTETMKRLIGSEQDLPELKKKLEELEGRKRKEQSRKTKLLEKITDLNLDAESYDETYDDLQGILQTHNTNIQEIDRDLAVVNGQIANAESRSASAVELQKFYSEAVEHFDDVGAEARKELMQVMLDRVEIWLEQLPNGWWLKSIRFKVPVALQGQLGTEFDMDYPDLGEGFLPNENNVETI